MTGMMSDPALQLLGVGLLAFVRIALIFVQAPILGSNHIPNTVLVGFAAAITVAIYPTLPVPNDMPTDLFPFFGALLTQACVGLVIGFVSFIVIGAAQFGGEMLDIQMGLSSAASFDPASHGAINLLRKVLFQRFASYRSPNRSASSSGLVHCSMRFRFASSRSSTNEYFYAEFPSQHCHRTDPFKTFIPSNYESYGQSV